MSRRLARSQDLPLSESNYLSTLNDVDLYKRVALLFQAGWTLQAIGKACSPSRGRSTIKSWVDRARLLGLIDSTPNQTQTQELSKPVPVPTHKTPKGGYQRLTPKSPGVPMYIRERLEEVAPIARLYRARMPQGHPYAQANQEMDDLVRFLYDHDVSTADIARACGVTHRAIAKRLDRLVRGRL